MPLDLIAQVYIGDQYRDTGWFGYALTLVLIGALLFNILRAKGGRQLYIRRIAGLNAIDEALGRATEMGKPVLMVPGLSDNLNAVAVQAINIFAHVSRIAARFANPILLCCYNAAVYTLAQEVIRDVYQQEGLGDRYDVDSVRFVSDRQFAFAAGVSGLIHREQTAATFFMGEFYAESLIFAETANSIGAIQIASTTQITQTPFFIAACDYVLIGDEFYAASAYLTREPVLVGSLVGQDWCKLIVIGSIFLGTLVNSVGTQATVTTTLEKGKEVPTMGLSYDEKGQPYLDEKGEPLMVPQARFRTPEETLIGRLFNPSKADVKIEREKDPEAKP